MKIPKSVWRAGFGSIVIFINNIMIIMVIIIIIIIIITIIIISSSSMFKWRSPEQFGEPGLTARDAFRGKISMCGEISRYFPISCQDILKYHYIFLKYINGGRYQCDIKIFSNEILLYFLKILISEHFYRGFCISWKLAEPLWSFPAAPVDNKTIICKFW